MNYHNPSIWHTTYFLCGKKIAFSILKTFWIVFCSSFSKKVPTDFSPLRSLITYVHGTIFLTFLITKVSSDEFGVYALAKMFLYFYILTWSPILNSGSLSLTFLPKLIYVLSLTSIGFTLIVLWYALLYLLTIYYIVNQNTHFSILRSCIRRI